MSDAVENRPREADYLGALTKRVHDVVDACRDGIVQDVPASLAACEFDCKVIDCSYDRWISCPRRLRQAELATR